MEYEFIERCVFFPEKGILAVGDLHLGWEAMLRQSGVLVPERQIDDVIRDLSNIFKIIKGKGKEVKKIIFIGDIKHGFSFEQAEKNEFLEVINFLGEKLPAENIILIKGNHDTIDYTFEGMMKPFHIEEDILFLHGHDAVSDLRDEKIKMIVMGHIHPSVILKDGAKKEAYKCFLDGEHIGKKVVVMPSFLDFVEGLPVNNYETDAIEGWSIIPIKALLKFDVHVIGGNEAFHFGKVKDLD